MGRTASRANRLRSFRKNGDFGSQSGKNVLFRNFTQNLKKILKFSERFFCSSFARKTIFFEFWAKNYFFSSFGRKTIFFRVLGEKLFFSSFGRKTIFREKLFFLDFCAKNFFFPVAYVMSFTLKKRGRVLYGYA